MNNQGLSIIIPTYNEATNICELVERITKACSVAPLAYEILFVDDHSTDATRSTIKKFAIKYPVSLYVKEGKRGKGYSILEGAKHAQYSHIAMLDADLQYPPEILPELFAKSKITGIGVAKRKTYVSSWYRTVASRLNALVFGHILLDLKTDVQSGLKVFDREVFDHLNPNLISAWAIDIPLLYTAYELGFTASHIDIDFKPRSHGASNVQFLQTAWEIGSGAIKTKLSTKIRRFAANNSHSMTGSGIAYRRKRYVTHTTLHHSLSALVSLSSWQKLAIATLCTFFGIGLLTNAQQTAIAFTTTISFIYFADVLFNVFIILKSLHFPPDIRISDEDVKKIKPDELPMYSILCPLYKEASVLPHFIESMNAMNWPKEKLDILLLLEEDDKETIQSAKNMQLPEHFSIVIVPDSQPKTKPKACNFGLNLAQGEYIVVYDAEDRPDPDQLKKSYLAFQHADPTVVCMQAKLNYYNPHDNLLTRLFTAEYSLWFDVVLPGLQSIQTTIPLGGTSNHFRTSELLHLEGWDPFNVTEDADLGARLFRKGYKTAIIDSTTLEEANSSVKNWFRQRSRWIKGYIQTYFVHFRNPFRFAKQYGHHAILFQLIVGGKIAFMLINPLLWIITISYFVLYSIVGPTIESIYPTVVFYMAATSLVVGNFVYLYNYMIGVAKRGQWELVKYVFFIPIYWLMISISAAIAVFQFIVKPYYWEKTIHGLHLSSAMAKKEKELLRHKTVKSRALKIQHLADLVLTHQSINRGILVISSLIGNVLNFLYNAYLGRHATIEDFGVISLIGSFLYVSNVPLSALSRTVTHKSAYLFGQFGHPVKEFWAHIRKKTYTYAFLIAFIWMSVSPLLMKFFHTENILPFLLFTPVWFFGALGAVDGGFLGGNLQFRTIAILATSEALGKLLFSAILVSVGLAKYVYVAIPLSLGISFAIGWWNASHTKSTHVPAITHNALRLPRKFFATSILSTFSSITFLSLDLMLAKHYLSPADAGAYSFLTLAGKMVYFLSSLATQFTNPLISRDIGAGKGDKQTFTTLLIVTLIINTVGFITFGLLGFITVPLLWGPKAIIIIQYLPQYTLAMVAYSISGLLITYRQIRGEYAFSIAGFFFSLIQLVGMFLFHDSVKTLTHVVSGSSFLTLIGIATMHMYYRQLSTLYRNILDFVGLFSLRLRPKTLESGKYRILIMNWYDARHVWAGGAEQYIEQIAKRWAKDGHEVTFFCGNDTTQKRYEKTDGVSYIRRGGQFTVALWAFIYYITKLQNKFDVIIDVPKGVPFFTPLYTRRPVICLIHQVHQDMFRTELRFPLRQISMFLEATALPIVYKNMNIIVVSESTKKAVEKIGLGKRKPIEIINPGIDVLPSRATKSSHPSILYLGRLRPYKFVDLLIIAVSNAKVSIPNLSLTIAGIGEDEDRLKALAKKLDMESYVTFTGKVSEKHKSNLYKTHWLSVQPSMVEGWGITNIEANYFGTPVIASNTDGLRDSVRHGYNGVLVEPQDPSTIEKAIISLIHDNTMRNTLSKNAKKWASNFTWDKSASIFMAHIQRSIAVNTSDNTNTHTNFIMEYLSNIKRYVSAHPVAKFVFNLTTKIF